MERAVGHSLFLLLTALTAASADAQPAEDSPAENQCILCHANSEVWEGETLHLFVAPEHLAGDAHWQKGIKCHDCHGGNPDTTDLRVAHAIEDGFRVIETPADVPNFCGHCHANVEYMRKFQPDGKTDQVAQYWNGVHGQHFKASEGKDAATCTSCHPHHQMRPVTDPASSLHPLNLAATCGGCHKGQQAALRKSVHHAAGERNEFGRGTPLDCLKCHGQDAHGMLPVRHDASPTRLEHQVAMCGKCHQKYLTTYDDSVHGHGLRQSGLSVTAVCSDCHQAHDIYYAADRRSSLHAANVGATCGKCHAFIEERLALSIHGQGGGAGAAPDRPPAGGKELRRPSCVDCHQGHDQPHPDSDLFREQHPNRCGNCHTDYALRYGLSLHGQLTHLGFAPAGKCSDCHGAHDILPVSDPQSRMAPARRLETCRQCHTKATLNFAAFDPHADHKDARRYPGLHATYEWTEVVLYCLFGVFVLHAFLWFTRSLIDALRFGRRPRLSAAEPGVLVFPPIHRLLYGTILVAFMGLTLTGLPLKYSDQAWARYVSGSLGGFGATSSWHHAFATAILLVCAAHAIWVLTLIREARRRGVSWRQMAFGPDSPVPVLRDAKDALGMVGWFLGMRRKPRFERWTYWEKFDYWAVCLAIVLIGGSGLLLWFPSLCTRVLPGQVLNVAHLLHSQTALLVAGCLFIIHFFNTHLRPEKFPMDLSIVTGIVSEEHLRQARPEYLERLRREGQLQDLRVPAPSRRRLRLAILSGLFVIVLGLGLLASSLVAYLGK